MNELTRILAHLAQKGAQPSYARNALVDALLGQRARLPAAPMPAQSGNPMMAGAISDMRDQALDAGMDTSDPARTRDAFRDAVEIDSRLPGYVGPRGSGFAPVQMQTGGTGTPDLGMYSDADAALGQAPRMTEGRPMMTFEASREAPPWQGRLAALANGIEEERFRMRRALESGNQEDASQRAELIRQMERERSLILDRYRPQLQEDPSGLGGAQGPFDPSEGLDPAKMRDALRGTYDDDRRFDDSRAVQVADASGGAPADDEPPPTPEQLATMAQRVGIDPDALKGLDLNTSEARNFGYLLRMMEAESVIRELSDSNRFGQRLLELLPGQDLEAIFMDPDYRRYMVARENFNEAALRSATGATINQAEMPTQRRNYFPLPTDDAETRKLLQRQREAVMMSLMAGSGPAARVVPEFGNPVVPRSKPIDGLSDEELLKMLEGGS